MGASKQVGVLTAYKILLIHTCCAFVCLDNKLYELCFSKCKKQAHIMYYIHYLSSKKVMICFYKHNKNYTQTP